MQILELLSEHVQTHISAPELEGLKELISRRIKGLPDDDSTAKALKQIEDLLSHVKHGGRYSSISKEISEIQNRAVHAAKKVLARLVLSIMEELEATPDQRKELFDLWQSDRLVNLESLLSNEQVDFSSVFNGYESNPVIKEFINEVMMISELGMGRGEFGLTVLSRSITTAGKASTDTSGTEGGSKKGDLQIKIGGKEYRVELKTELAGAARFGDQEVRPAEGFESAAVALNTFVKQHKAYKKLTRKLSGSGMNLNQAIAFNQLLLPSDQNKFLGLVRNCIELIFGNTAAGRKDFVARLKKNVNGIMASIESGNPGSAAQHWSQASFNYYMSKKHDDGILYTDLNNKTFIYYNDAEQLTAQGLRFHASTPYISATKDPVRAVYPQISIQPTTFGADAAHQGIKQASKGKNPLNNPRFTKQVADVAHTFALRRGIKNQNLINKIGVDLMNLIAGKTPPDQAIANLEQKYPQLKPKIVKPKVQPQQPVPQPTTTPGIRNQSRVPGQDKEVMGQTPR